MWSVGSAPANCTRCALEWAIDRGFTAVDREVLMGNGWHWATSENLDMLVEVMQAGHFHKDSYYVWVAREDNYLRPLHAGDLADEAYVHKARQSAEDTARRCIAAFPSGSAWVATYRGIWKLPNRA